MKLLVWSGTPSGTGWSSPDSAEGFSLAVLSHSTHTKWVFHRLGFTSPEFYSGSTQGAASVDTAPTLKHPNVNFSMARRQLELGKRDL